MSDITQSPAYRCLVDRMAHALAVSDGDDVAADYRAHKANAPAGDDAENVYVDYRDTIDDMMAVSQMRGAFALLAEICHIEQPKPYLPADAAIDYIEAYIVEREENIMDINGQLERAKLNDCLERTPQWERAARNALNFRRKELRFALRLRLALLRKAGNEEIAPYDHESIDLYAQIRRSERPVDAQKDENNPTVLKLRTRVRVLEDLLAQMRVSRDTEVKKRVDAVEREYLNTAMWRAALEVHTGDAFDRIQGNIKPIIADIQKVHKADPSQGRNLARFIKEWTKAKGCMLLRRKDFFKSAEMME